MTPGLLAFQLGTVGLIVGCFLGLVSIRWPAGEPIVVGRSHCRSCRRVLSLPDLVPVASYVSTRGRCRTCSAPVPVRYPLMELTAAAVGVWSALAGMTTAEAVLGVLLGWQLLLIAVIGFEQARLPISLTVPLLVTGLAAGTILDRPSIPQMVLGAFAGLGASAIVEFLHRHRRDRDSLGQAPPLLFAAAGAWVGWGGLPLVLLIAILIGVTMVAVRRLYGGRFQRSVAMPLAPMLAVGIWLTWIRSL